jgi:hypothetical protein
VLDKPKAGFARQMSQVLTRACGEVIDTYNPMTFTQQAIGKVRAKETGSAGDNHMQGQKYILSGSESAAPEIGTHTGPKWTAHHAVDCVLNRLPYMAMLGLRALSCLVWKFVGLPTLT